MLSAINSTLSPALRAFVICTALAACSTGDPNLAYENWQRREAARAEWNEYRDANQIRNIALRALQLRGEPGSIPRWKNRAEWATKENNQRRKYPETWNTYAMAETHRDEASAEFVCASDAALAFRRAAPAAWWAYARAGTMRYAAMLSLSADDHLAVQAWVEAEQAQRIAALAFRRTAPAAWQAYERAGKRDKKQAQAMARAAPHEFVAWDTAWRAREALENVVEALAPVKMKAVRVANETRSTAAKALENTDPFTFANWELCRAELERDIAESFLYLAAPAEWSAWKRSDTINSLDDGEEKSDEWQALQEKNRVALQRAAGLEWSAYIAAGAEVATAKRQVQQMVGDKENAQKRKADRTDQL